MPLLSLPPEFGHEPLPAPAYQVEPAVPLTIREDEEDESDDRDEHPEAKAHPLDLEEERAERLHSEIADIDVEEILADVSEIRRDEKGAQPYLDDARRERNREAGEERDAPEEKNKCTVAPLIAAKALAHPLDIAMRQSEETPETSHDDILQLVADDIPAQCAKELPEIADEDEPDEKKRRMTLQLREKSGRRHDEHGRDRRDHFFGERSDKDKQLQRDVLGEEENKPLDLADQGFHRV